MFIVFFDNNQVVLKKYGITKETYNFNVCYYDDVFSKHKDNIILGIVFDNTYVMRGTLVVKWYYKNKYLPFIIDSETGFLFEEYYAEWLEIKFNGDLIRLNKDEDINSDFIEKLLKSESGELYIDITSIDMKSSLCHQIRYVYTDNEEVNNNNFNAEVQRSFLEK